MLGASEGERHMSAQITNYGIYDDFHGYRLPTQEELDSALQSALVIVDANVLLNLYRYNESTRDDLLVVLRGLGERLWVPHQDLRKFWRNRISVLAGLDANTDQALTALRKQQRATVDALYFGRRPRRWKGPNETPCSKRSTHCTLSSLKLSKRILLLPHRR
jgi:hypothetical protein